MINSFNNAEGLILPYAPHSLTKSFNLLDSICANFTNSDIIVSLGFYGDCSTYKELPKPSEITDYTKYKSPYWDLEKSQEEYKSVNLVL